MNENEGLDLAEDLVLGPLEDSPLPLWELGWAGVPAPQRVAERDVRSGRSCAA